MGGRGECGELHGAPLVSRTRGRSTGDGSRGCSSPYGSLGRFAPFGRAIRTATNTRESLGGRPCPATRNPAELPGPDSASDERRRGAEAARVAESGRERRVDDLGALTEVVTRAGDFG